MLSSWSSLRSAPFAFQKLLKVGPDEAQIRNTILTETGDEIPALVALTRSPAEGNLRRVAPRSGLTSWIAAGAAAMRGAGLRTPNP